MQSECCGLPSCELLLRLTASLPGGADREKEGEHGRGRTRAVQDYVRQAAADSRSREEGRAQDLRSAEDGLALIRATEVRKSREGRRGDMGQAKGARLGGGG